MDAGSFRNEPLYIILGLTVKNSIITHEYVSWLTEVKSKIQGSRVQTALAVNKKLIDFYLELGEMISEKESTWGSRLLEQLSADLKSEFSDEFKGSMPTVDKIERGVGILEGGDA